MTRRDTFFCCDFVYRWGPVTRRYARGDLEQRRKGERLRTRRNIGSPQRGAFSGPGLKNRVDLRAQAASEIQRRAHMRAILQESPSWGMRIHLIRSEERAAGPFCALSSPLASLINHAPLLWKKSYGPNRDSTVLEEYGIASRRIAGRILSHVAAAALLPVLRGSPHYGRIVIFHRTTKLCRGPLAMARERTIYRDTDAALPQR